MGYVNLCFLVFLPWVFFISGTNQMLTSQTHVLVMLRKQLEYPKPLEIWVNYNGDLCNLPPSPLMTVTCLDDCVIELKIKGDKPAKVRKFNEIVFPSHTLSPSFSIDSLFTTLSKLSSLRVLSLVSLGIWGALPDKIHRLSSLEVLDLSSNFMFGSIPPRMSTLVKLQTMTLDENCFNDTVPAWLDSLLNLTNLSLKHNRFNGHFPTSISRIRPLTVVALSQNELSGGLPDMSTLTSLHLLDLRENHFDSKLPAMPRSLITALLSRNSFSGKIPKQYGELTHLQHLDLSFNYLTGTPPPALFSLPNMSYLNLASNLLSGSLSTDLTCGNELGLVNISGNKLVGGLPSCLETTSSGSVVIVSGNCLANGAQHQKPYLFCKDSHVKRKQSQGKQIGISVGIAGGIVLAVTFLFMGLVLWHRRYSSRGTLGRHVSLKEVQDSLPAGLSSDLLANARLISQAAKLGAQGSHIYRVYTFEELKEATNNFDLSRFLGEGSIGKLYKGTLEGGTHVAIRSITLYKKSSIRNLKLQLDFLSKLRHPNLVGLLGHCIAGAGQADSCANIFLIYEYVPNGNYRAQLSEDYPGRVLKWPDRLAILIGVAKGVHFLHTGKCPGSFNNQLKTNNILLDENQIPKLSDYGMYIVTEEKGEAEAQGEDLKLWQATRPCDDVYNFGFILVESLLGPIVSGKGDAFLLSEMTSFSSQDGRRRIIDPIVLTTCSQESLSIVVSITNKCVSSETSTRPSFEDVLWNLHYAAQVQAAADADQKSETLSQS